MLPSLVSLTRMNCILVERICLKIELSLLGRDGKSRQFAFIGYRTNEEAEEALKYFNNTYIDTCKITCEVLSFLIVFNNFFPRCRANSLVNCLYEIELDSDDVRTLHLSCYLAGCPKDW
jgi:hypothetical protein